jgi:anti-anti-sigma factor
MPDTLYHHVECPALILSITEAQLQGDLVADALREDLLSAVDRSGARSVVLDFRRVTYVSSVAFRPLLSLHRKLKQGGGRLILCGMNDRVTEVFHVTRLISTTGVSAAPFESQPDVPAAVASLFRAS